MYRLDPISGTFTRDALTDELAFAQGLGVFETIKLVLMPSSGDNSPVATSKLYAYGDIFDEDWRQVITSTKVAENIKQQLPSLGYPEFLEAHLKRLEAGVRTFFPQAPKLDLDLLKKAVFNFIVSHKLTSGALKIVYAASGFDTGTLYFNHDERHYASTLYEQGVKIKIAAGIRCSHNRLLKFKTLSNMENMLELHQVRASGLFESVYLNERGEVAEGTVSNIFWERDGVLYTPALDTGILPGIMRAEVIKKAQQNGQQVCEGYFKPEALFQASKVFLTNSLLKTLPVAAIENGSEMLTY